MSLIYGYGVIEEKLPIAIDITGLEQGEIGLIPFKDLFAVVSYVSEKNFSQEAIDKNFKNMGWLTENAPVHEKVIEAVMEKTAIIPFKFCTIFKTRDNLAEMLEEKYAELKYNLNHLKDRVEMGVKVYFDAAGLKDEIKAESAEIKDLEKEAEQKTPGAAYFVRQKIDILLKEKVRQKLSGKKKEIFEKMEIFGEEVKQNDLLNKKMTGKEMLLNMVFLVEKKNLATFKAEIETVKKEFPRFEFELWGPFPPYNFVK